MKRGLLVALPFLLLLALGLAAWWQWRPAPPSDLPQSSQDNEVPSLPAPPPVPATPASPAPPAPVVDPAKAAAQREVLQQRAQAGDAVAAAELGRVLVACAHYAPIPAENIEEAVVNGFAAGLEPPQINGQPMTPELLVGLFEVSQRWLGERCAGQEGLVEPEDAAQGMALLQQAAEAGQAMAMIDYAMYAFHDFDGPEDMLRRAAEVKARRDRARDYLDRAVAAGEPRALLARADARVRSGLLPPDAAAGYADLYAFVQSGAAVEWPPGLAQRYLALLAEGLDATQLSRAQEQGEAIWRSCCGGARP